MSTSTHASKASASFLPKHTMGKEHIDAEVHHSWLGMAGELTACPTSEPGFVAQCTLEALC